MTDHRTAMSRWSVRESLQQGFTQAAEWRGLDPNREMERVMAEYIEHYPTVTALERQRQKVEEETRKLAEMESAAKTQAQEVAKVNDDKVGQEIAVLVATSKGQRVTTKTIRFWAINTAKRLGKHVDSQEVERRTLAALREAGIELVEAA